MRTLRVVAPMKYLLSAIGGHQDVTSTSFSKNITIKVKRNHTYILIRLIQKSRINFLRQKGS